MDVGIHLEGYVYKSILVPLDGSPRAERILPHVKTMADRFKARIKLVQVVEPHIEFSGWQTAHQDQAIEVFHSESSRSFGLQEVIIMRYFKCFDCEHLWEIIFWEDGKGTRMACPECRSLNVHQIEKVHGWDREGMYTSLVKDENLSPTNSEREPDRNLSLKIESLPPKNPSQNKLTSTLSTILNLRILNGFIERFINHTP